MVDLSSYLKSAKLVYSLFKYKESHPPNLTITTEEYTGVDNEHAPVKIINPTNYTEKIVILYPGASPLAENHPKMDMLARLLAKLEFKVYIPRIPPLKSLDLSSKNVEWFISFYKWILDIKKHPSKKIFMVGISFGGAIMLKAIHKTTNKIPHPKTILTYGTYSNSESMLKFLIDGKITTQNQTYETKPHEWGLIVLFHNFLKNIQTKWDSKDLEYALELKVKEQNEECNKFVEDLPKLQKHIFSSIVNSNVTPEVKNLAEQIVDHHRNHMDELSPRYWAENIKNKIFILHGANDTMVPFTESIQLAKFLPNTELLISHLYEHNEMSKNRSPFYILIEVLKFINFYAKLFHQYEN